MLCTYNLLITLLLLCLASRTTAKDNPDLFRGSRLALDASFGLRPKSINDTGSQSIRILPLIPGNSLDNQETIINNLFKRAPNTHSYLWARWEADQVSAAALGHVKYCAVEANRVGWRRPHRRSFCATRVKGNVDSLEEGECGEVDEVSTIPLVEDFEQGNDSESLESGTGFCYQQGVCSGDGDGNIVFDGMNLNTFVVLAEQPQNASQSVPLDVYLDGTREGGNWYQEQLVERQSPLFKELFPNITEPTFGGSGSDGTVLVSYRQGHVLGSACLDDPDESPGANQTIVDEAVQARVSEEIGVALNRAVSGGVSMRPAEVPELVLIIVASFIALFGANASLYVQSVVLIKTDEETGDQIVDKEAIDTYVPSKRGLNPILFAFATLFKVALELLPIFFLLAFEIRASKQVDITGFEVIGTGPVADVPQGTEVYHQMATGLVIVAVKNTHDNIVVVAIFCGILSLIAVVLAGWEFYFFGRKRKSI